MLKFQLPRIVSEEVQRVFDALVDGLKRQPLVGNYQGDAVNGQVPTYNSSKKVWEPKTPSGGGGGGVTDGDKGDIVVSSSGTVWNLDSAVTASIAAKLPNPTTVELDFGSTTLTDKLFNIVDASVSTSSKIIANICWLSTLGRSMDEIAVDGVEIAIEPKAGSFDVRAVARWGRVSGKYGLAYTVG